MRRYSQHMSRSGRTKRITDESGMSSSVQASSRENNSSDLSKDNLLNPTSDNWKLSACNSRELGTKRNTSKKKSDFYGNSSRTDFSQQNLKNSDSKKNRQASVSEVTKPGAKKMPASSVAERQITNVNKVSEGSKSAKNEFSKSGHLMNASRSHQTQPLHTSVTRSQFVAQEKVEAMKKESENNPHCAVEDIRPFVAQVNSRPEINFGGHKVGTHLPPVQSEINFTSSGFQNVRTRVIYHSGEGRREASTSVLGRGTREKEQRSRIGISNSQHTNIGVTNDSTMQFGRSNSESENSSMTQKEKKKKKKYFRPILGSNIKNGVNAENKQNTSYMGKTEVKAYQEEPALTRNKEGRPTSSGRVPLETLSKRGQRQEFFVVPPFNPYGINAYGNYLQPEWWPCNYQFAMQHGSSRKQDHRDDSLIYLKSLITKRLTSEVMSELMSEKSKFGRILCSPPNPLCIVSTVQILGNVCEANVQGKDSLISSVFVKAHTKFHEGLTQFTASMYEHNIDYETITCFLRSLYSLYLYSIKLLLPGRLLIRWKNVLCNVSLVIGRSQDRNSESEWRDKFENLYAYFCDYINEKETSDEFRSIPVLPLSEDLLNLSKPPLKRNVVRGPYITVDQYLDTQFRLLHEDFSRPLREGISTFIHKASDEMKLRKLKNVRFYNNVTFVKHKIIGRSIGYLVEFDSDGKLKNYQWQNSKRFLFGSLLCFTKDNFKTLLLGIVCDRKLTDLKKGLTLVNIYTPVDDDDLQGYFLMAESEVYFEPYRCVLQALQTITDENFPMKAHIITVENKRTAPLYLQTNTQVLYTIESRVGPILQLSTWLKCETLNLDQSQFQALQTALTTEFVVIQGPPGTGKTYIGLKICKILLDNLGVWNTTNTPLFVVCYTNHALDQFLEGIAEFTQNIVRVGCQSQSDMMSKFSLKAKRKEFRRDVQNISESRDASINVDEILYKIRSIILILEEISNRRGIISLQVFRKFRVVGELHYQQIVKQSDAADSFLKWLEYGKDAEEVEYLNSYQSVIQSDKDSEEDLAFQENDIDEDRRFEDDPLFETDETILSSDLKYIVTTKKLENEISDLEGMKKSLHSDIVDKDVLHRRGWMIEDELTDSKKQMEFLLRKMVEPSVHDANKIESLLMEKNILTLSTNEKWLLYWFWVSKLKEVCKEEFKKLEKDYKVEFQKYLQAQQRDDALILQKAHVVGMTTTGAARLQTMLQSLKPKIVIVEEAAEVLESHIIVSLTHYCEHLILIGDHQQLRPSTASYDLAREFHLDISLFERMVNNNVHREQLLVQHRMRPEIVQLIVPTIYPRLLDHHSVQKYENIKGVCKNLFFVNHNFPEEHINDSCSQQNKHEAHFLLELCRYLVYQGYHQDNITILTFYSSQMFYLRAERNKDDLLKLVRVSVVDNFQGEENDIILLSLVRSNPQGDIGFLRDRNRVCVALSRAKKGFYIIGNMETLTQENSLWKSVRKSLEHQDAVGRYLTLKCQTHNAQTFVSKREDFRQVQEGGCSKQCNVALDCGHSCRNMCHSRDVSHNLYRCKLKCSRFLCSRKHQKCSKLCWEPCDTCNAEVNQQLPCGHCIVGFCSKLPEKYTCEQVVEKYLPLCGHKLSVPCNTDVSKIQCTMRCECQLPCGHKCKKICHPLDDREHLNYKCQELCLKVIRGCSRNHVCPKRCWEECGECTLLVMMKLPNCNHYYKLACNKNPSFAKCKERCRKMLKCGHPCYKLCYEPCGKCFVEVEKVIPGCAHTIRVKCCEEPRRNMCKETCQRILPCGHKCKEFCGQMCTPSCKEVLDATVEACCKHSVPLLCYEKSQGIELKLDDLLSRCTARCEVILNCGHMCKGSCKECFQKRIHMPCMEQCRRTLLCGHRCNFLCVDNCPPCKLRCKYGCKHSTCSERCGDCCKPCKEPCDWKCPHFTCTKLCFQPCDRPPCRQPCDKLLSCGHSCIGFCGELCPPLCRICDESQMNTDCVAYTGDEYSRYVYMGSCKHIVESNFMDKLMVTADDTIGIKKCPKCGIPIICPGRYGNNIKKQFFDICSARRELYLDQKNIKQKLSDLCTVLKSHPFSMQGLDIYTEMKQDILKELREFTMSKETKNISQLNVETLEVKTHILDAINAIMLQIKGKLTCYSLHKLLKYMTIFLSVIHPRERVSNQQVDDINLELLRLRRIAQICLLDSTVGYIKYTESIWEMHQQYERNIFTVEKFSGDDEVQSVLLSMCEQLEMDPEVLEIKFKKIRHSLNFSEGRWLKCPNGHTFSLQDSNELLTERACLKCNARLGLHKQEDALVE